jgi:hypothetical protein
MFMAKESDAILDQRQLAATGRRIRVIAKVNPGLTDVAWKATGSILDYSSMATPLPKIQWVGPAPFGLPGFAGLFGLIEMANVQVFGSANFVPLERASRVISLSAEQQAVELMRSKGYSNWPEFEMIVGGDDSNIVLDKLHLRNAILRHMNTVYGGAEALFENVTS